MADMTAMVGMPGHGFDDRARVWHRVSALLVLALAGIVLLASSCAGADSPSEVWVEIRPPAQVFSVKAGQETIVRVSFTNYANDTRLYFFSLEGDLSLVANLPANQSRLGPGEVTEIEVVIAAPLDAGGYERVLVGLAEGTPPLRVRITVSVSVVSDQPLPVPSDDNIEAYAKVWSVFPCAYEAAEVRLVTPVAVTEDLEGRWFIVDKSTKEVYVVDEKMHVVAIVGNTSRSTIFVPLNDPVSAAINSQGIVYIADFGFRAIHVLDSNLTYLGRIPIEITGLVNGIAVDSRDRLFVAYWRSISRSRILVFAPSRTDIRSGFVVLETILALCPPNDPDYLKWGICGEPTCIAFDSQDRIIVSENYGGSDGPFHLRLDIFNEDLEWVTSYSGQGDGPGRFQGLFGVAVGPGDVIAASDPNADKISFFFPNGTYAGRMGRAGPNAGEFLSPLGMCVTRSGSLLVADSAKNQIQEITLDWASLRRVEAVSEIHFLSFILLAYCISLRRSVIAP